ncbi:MAG: AraC family transcriptional regulator [Solirubrobacteraceae bacterium]
MAYREHAPPPELAPWLECTWERHSERGVPVRVLPDGCIDLVWTEGKGTQVVGANTTAFLVALPGGVRIAGARLRPGAAPSLLGVASEAVRDARVPVAELWAAGDAGYRLAAALDEQPDPVEGLRAELRGRAARAALPDPLVREAISRLARPGVAIAPLAGELGVSERQLRRRVSGAVGYGPKRLARVLRLLRALQAGRAGDDLARVALDAGYADQAHFANDCRALAGVAPSVLLAE